MNKKMYSIIIETESKKELLKNYLNNKSIFFNISGLDNELYYFSILADSDTAQSINNFLTVVKSL